MSYEVNIYCRDQEHSNEIQQKLFDAGYSWLGQKRIESIDSGKQHYLYLTNTNGNKRILYSNVAWAEKQENLITVTVDDFLDGSWKAKSRIKNFKEIIL